MFVDVLIDQFINGGRVPGIGPRVIGSSPRSISRFRRLASSLAAITDQLGQVPIIMRRCRPAAR